MSWFREWLTGEGARRPTNDAEGPSPAPVRDGGPRSSRPGGGTGTGRTTTAAPAGPLEPGYPGERLGFPEHGPGSVATLARRGAQFFLDTILAGLVAALFTYPDLPQNWSLVSWAVLMLVPVAVIGMSPAMVLLGMRVVRLDRPGAAGVGPLWTLVRTASVFFIIPALIIDRDSRGIHDRASRTVVIRTR